MFRFRTPLSPKWCAMVLLCVAAPAFSQSSVHRRIALAVNGGQMTRLQGNLHPLARAEYDQGRVDADLPMENISIAFSLSPSQQVELQSLLAAQQEPTSPLFHQWLTPEQYADRFGLSQDDLDKVNAWLQSQGFTNLHAARSRTQISFGGTAAQVESAFRTEIHRYEINGKAHIANSTELSVPAALADVVLGVRNLTDFRAKPHSRPIPHFTSGQSGNHYLSPGDFATIYDIAPLYAAGFDGSGVTIAVMGQTLIDVNDANSFRSAAGLSVNPPIPVQAGKTGAGTTCSGDLNEANLDVEWSGGVARSATILYVYAGVGTGGTCDQRNSDIFDALNYTIENDLAPVISISYGLCEADFTQGFANTVRTWVQHANVQGQTLTAASGDVGAADCDGDSATAPKIAVRGLAVDAPASIPEVTGVGGTEFTGDTTTGADAPYWAAASGTTDNISSALTYIPEMAWNDSPTTGTGTPPLATSLSATGGGVSTVFITKPTWQAALTPADGARDVPDITLAGSPDHDGYLVCVQGSCANGFREANGDLNVFGGTSVGAQVFGGILAILNQATQFKGLGNANIELYALAHSTPGAFHDITSGTNIVPCTAGTPTGATAGLGCPSSGAAQIGYSAKAGYDLASGLGSLDVNNLAHAWTGFTATPPFKVSAATNPIVVSAGANGSSVVTVSSTTGFTGNVTLACSFVGGQAASNGLSCSFAPSSSVPLSGSATSGTATLNVGTTAAGHAIANPSARGGSTNSWFAASGAAFLACICVVGIPGRKRRGAAMFVLLIGAVTFAGIGCGGGSSSSGGGGGTTTTPTAATPVFTPASGDYTGNVTVSVSDSTSGALLFCTSDGTTPTSASTACATTSLTANTTLKAIAIESGFNNSTVASGTYTIQSGTATGSYVVQVTAKSGSETQSTNVNVTVN